MNSDISLKISEIISATNFVKDFKICSEKLGEDPNNKYFVFKNNEPNMVVITPQKYQFFEYWVKEGSRLREQKITSIAKHMLSIMEKKDKDSHYEFCKECSIIFKVKENKNVCPLCDSEFRFYNDSNESIADKIARDIYKYVDEIDNICVIQENDEFIKFSITI